MLVGVLGRRWNVVSRPVRAAVLVAVVVLAYGTAAHVEQLVAAGLNPYPALPGWLRAYFIALTVLDPLAASLLARRLRSGVVLAVAVLVSDAAANAYANYGLDPSSGVTTGRVVQALVTVLAVAMVVVAPRLWRCGPSQCLHR